MTKTDECATFGFVDSQEYRFQEGDKISLIRVRFPGNAKVHAFLTGKRKFRYGQQVVAMSDRGLTVGHINSFPYETTFKENMLPLRAISKAADDEDVAKQKLSRAKEIEAEMKCRELIEYYELDMTLTHVEFVQNGRKVIFYFNAPARVDFRELVKSLVPHMKMRIELRQISVRDRTAALGAIGVCGLQTCCSSFLTQYGNVSIKMAKNQNLALSQNRINGVCGQIKCCIKYEDDVYSEKRNRLPKEGDCIQTKNNDQGRVYHLHILKEQFEMLTDQGKKRKYSSAQYVQENKLPEDWALPMNMMSIIDETHEVIT